jgi:DNA-binding HxlR family transcriptional regulator
VTARSERAVRADPGATPGRREVVGTKSSHSNRGTHSQDSGANSNSIGDPNSLIRGPSVIDRSGGFARNLGPTTPFDSRTLAGDRSSSEECRSSEHESPMQSYVTYDPSQLLHELRGGATFQTWLFLYRQGPANASQIRRRLKSGQAAIDSSLGRLVRMGLANRKTLRSFPFTKVYSLTERGRKLAETPISSWPTLVVE